MKKLFLVCVAAMFLTGCEHVNFEFDWGMLAESVVDCFHAKSGSSFN